MPLLKGSSKKVVSQNISEFHTGKTYAHTLRKFGSKKANAQAVAVALSTARKYARKAEGGADLEDPRLKAIGIRPIEGTPDAPEQPVQSPPQGSGFETEEQFFLRNLNSGAPGYTPPSLSQGTSLPEGRRGPGTRAWEGMKHAITDNGDFGISAENLAANPQLLPLQPFAAAGDLGMRGLSAAVHGAAGLVGGVAEDYGNLTNLDWDRGTTGGVSAGEPYQSSPSAGDRAERDALIAGQAPELGPNTFQPATQLAGKALKAGVAAIPENTLGVVGGKGAFGQYFHPYDFNPEDLKKIKQTGPQKGSNPGGLYELPSGEPVYIKTPKTHEHTYNEKLATELYKLADVPVAELKMSKFKGKPSLVSPIIPGKELSQIGDFSQTQGLAEHYPVDLWLGNFDALKKDNVIVTDHNQAYRIDMGGALRFRAQGEPKTPAMWGPDVQHFDPNKNPGAAAMKGQPNVDMMPAAQRVANITDQQIHDLVEKFGPTMKTGQPKLKLEETLKARRDKIAEMYGVQTQKQPAPVQAAANTSQLAKGLADKYYSEFNENPYQIANKLYEIQKQLGKNVSDAIATELPSDVKMAVGKHLDAIEVAENYKAKVAPAQAPEPPKTAQPLGVSTKSFQDDVQAFDPSEKWTHYDALHDQLAGQPLGLNQGQKEAVSHWTDPAGYKDLNGYLRGANKSQTAAELVPKLDSAMAAHPLQQDTVLWRGIHGPHADQLIGLKEGDTFFSAGYTATTIDPRRATHYGKKSDPGIILNYHMPAGSEGLYTSHPDSGGWSTKEREVLLPHGQGFKITGIEKIKAPIWDYTGDLTQAKPHDFTVYHVEPIWGSAGTQLDAVKGATPLPAKSAAPKQSPSWNQIQNIIQSNMSKKHLFAGANDAKIMADDLIKQLQPTEFADKLKEIANAHGKPFADAVAKHLPQQAAAKPLTDAGGITAEDKAEAILKFSHGDEAKVKHNLGVQSQLYGDEYGKAVAEAIEKAKGPKKYTWNGMTLADPDKMANALKKTPGKIDDKIANLEKMYGKEYATAVANAHDDALSKEITKSFKQEPFNPDDYQDAHWGDDPNHPAVEPPENLTSEDYSQSGLELKFHGKPWFGKNTKEQVIGEWDTHRIEQEMKKGDGVIQILNNKQWVDEYRPPTKKNHKPVATPNAISNPTEGGFNQFVEFHHNTPNKGPSGYLEQILDPKKKDLASGTSYDSEHALYGLDYPFKGYHLDQTGPYLMNPKKVAVAYWPNFFGETLAEKKNNGEGASAGMQKRIIAAAHKEGVDLVVLHGMNDTGGINQTQYLVINNKILRAKDAKFDPARFNATAIDPATGHEYSHTMWGIAGASAVGAGLMKGQKGEDDKMARGGKVKYKPFSSIQNLTGLDEGYQHKPYHTPKKAKKLARGGATEPEPQDHEFINFKRGGMIESNIPGRTDKIPMKVATGAYVLPADIPSALGQGNTIAGKSILDKMFNSGPYGLPLQKGKSSKFQMPHLPHLKGFAQGGRAAAERVLPPDHELGMKVPKGGSMCANCSFFEGDDKCGNDGFAKWHGSHQLPQPANEYCCDLYAHHKKMADGGGTDHTPIIAAGGEYIIHPDEVLHQGNGSMTAGHKVLDQFVLHTRKEHIKTLKNLKGPK